MSTIPAQLAAVANRLSTYLRLYTDEVGAMSGSAVEATVKVPSRRLPEADAASAVQIRNAGTFAPRLPEGERPIFPARTQVAEIVRRAGSRTGNFTIGTADRAGADAAGLTWVGTNSRRLRYGPTYRLVSADGLRQYRPPQLKPSGRGVQANYERRSDPNRHWESNAHVVITEE